MIGIIGRKLGMTQIFNEQGQQIPVTVVEAPPNPVLHVSDKDHAGFAAVQLGFGAQRVARASKEGAGEAQKGRGRKRAASEREPRGRRAPKAAVGHAAKAGLEAPPKVLRSFRLDDAPGKNPELPSYSVGDTVTVELFAPGDQVKVTGTTKGRGFQGVVKRHGFGGGPNTHGNTKHRRPGSIGPGTDPSRVIKGKKMPGHYGAERATQTHLRVERVDAERNLIYIRGALPGARNGIVTIRKQG
jgi:large subunit ribosomal protein L3